MPTTLDARKIDDAREGAPPAVPATDRETTVESDPVTNDDQEPLSSTPATAARESQFAHLVSQWFGRERLGTSAKIILTMSILSLAPAILLMTTSFIRISIVLGMLRHAFGAQQLPSNQIVTSLSLFVTGLIMWPVWSEVYTRSIEPYSAVGSTMSWEEAWTQGVAPVREFMSRQISLTKNHEDVFLFLRQLPDHHHTPETYDDVPLQALLPAFVLSELKTAFLIGFQIFLPFLVIDIVVAAVTTAMGMIMLPPTMISLPMKLALFVLVDGWRLVVGMLLDSFQAG